MALYNPSILYYVYVESRIFSNASSNITTDDINKLIADETLDRSVRTANLSAKDFYVRCTINGLLVNKRKTYILITLAHSVS